jgi:putative tricarboxylic transport membrane protein
MDEISRLLQGLEAGLSPMALLVILIGVVVGLIAGAAPGMGPTLAMAMSMPVALTMTPENAVILLCSILIGSGFGNSIPAVIIKVPGTAGAVLTAVEGYPLHKRGEGGRALLVCLVACTVGGLLGIVAFILFVVPLSQVAVKLLFPETFAIVLLGLLAAAGLVEGRVVKGLMSVAIGLLLSTIGPDPVTGHPRFTFGIDMLAAGLDVLPVIVGLFALREVFAAAGDKALEAPDRMRRLRVGWLSRKDLKDIAAPTAWGTLAGLAIGAMPAAGGSVATVVGYQAVKSTTRDKSQFGKGSIKGLAGIDSANNACVGGDMIPTFGLGIPGSAPMVVVMALLTAQGLQVGPNLLNSRPELLYAAFGGLLVSVFVLAVIGYFVIGPSIYLSKLSPAATQVLTAALVVVGVYSLRWNMFDVWVALAAGLAGYVLGRYGYSVVAIGLAFVLGGILESSFRRGIIMTGGWVEFFTRPVTMGILVVSGILLGVSVLLGRGKRSEALTTADD